MADLSAIQAELARRKVQAALGAQGAQPSGFQRAAEALARGPMPIMGMIAHPKESAQTLLEAGGAAVGAGAGGMVGGLPGAIVGGAGGGRLGHAAGSYAFGETPEHGEMDVAGAAGAAGPVMGRLAQLGGRLLAQLPSKGRAVAEQTRLFQSAQGNAALTAQEAHVSKIADAERRLAKYRAIAERNGSEMPLLGRAQRELDELKAMAVHPELTVARAKAKVQATRAPAGTAGLSMGAIIGSTMGGLESTITGGAIGFMLGRLDHRLAVRLVNNPEFVQWATGIRGQSIADAAATFVTDVQLRGGGEAEDSFMGELMDLSAGVIAGAYTSGATGSPMLSMGAGVAASTAMEEVRHGAAEALEWGERVWDELLGRKEGQVFH